MRKLYLILVLCMIWTNVALADETIDGITYSLNSSTSTATVTNTPSGSVVIPATVTYNNRKYNVTAITGVNSGITSVEIPEGVTSIGKAFYFHTSLTSVVIPSTVQIIEREAFKNCYSLMSLVIHSGVQRIEYEAFRDCHSLTTINIPEGLTYIGPYSFFACSNLQNITIPTSLTIMGIQAFANCKKLTQIIWNAKNCADFDKSENAPFIWYENGYSHGNNYTTSIVFGEEVDYIPAYLCYRFEKVFTVELSNSVREIGTSAFSGMTNLKSVKLGMKLEKIGSYAFDGSPNLTSIDIPDKCTSLGIYAFGACGNLSSISLGKDITIIGNNAFCNSSNINTINIYATTPPVITKDVFNSVSDLMAITLNVRSKALDAYKNAAVWKDMYVQAMENDIRTFTLSVSSADESKGTTTQGGAYDEDSEILIYAAAKDGYKFSKWNDGNTENPRTVKMIGNLSFVAQFEPFIPVPAYTITTSANAVEGSVVGGGIYELGNQVSLAAIGNTGYHFTQWADGNTTNPRQITVTSNGSYTAQFAKDPAKYTLTTSSTNATQGTAYGQGKYEEGTSLAIFAVANEGYHFSQWHDGNTDNPRMITVSADAMYFANFAQDPVAPSLYELTVKPANTAQGWTTEGGAYEWGKQLMVYAHPANGFVFSQWSDGNTENPRFLTITGNVDLTAQFEVGIPSGVKSTYSSEMSAPTRKIVRNGQIFIEYGDKTYSSKGIEVK